MIEEKLALQLYDKATRGVLLIDSERKLLEDWYAQKDREENSLLNATNSTNSALDRQIDIALGQIQLVTQSIQKLTAENESLKREIASLYLQLAQTKRAQVR